MSDTFLLAAQCGLMLLGGYLLNILYITVFYHRGLTHGAVKLSPLARRWVVLTGNWVTGLDPKGWACMHRMHHTYSDTPQDPHSPMNLGVIGVALGQLRSYEKTLVGLQKGRSKYTDVVKDLDFPVNWLNRKGLWFVPYVLHLTLGIVVGIFSGIPLLGISYFVGIMSHPVQGWMVNALAHQYGYSNFETPDHSRNNTAVALLVAGEGYQNNHHQYPQAAKFSVKWFEIDWGYTLCLVLEKLGVLEVVREKQKANQKSASAFYVVKNDSNNTNSNETEASRRSPRAGDQQQQQQPRL